MPTITEIRQQYPDYADLSDQQIAEGLHKKYYSDMPVETFNQKIGLSQVPSPEEQARLTHSTPVPNSEFAPEWKKNVSAIARPVLETGGMVGGGLLAGAFATPETLGIGTIPAGLAGSALGYAGGKGLANKLDEAMGLKETVPLGQEFVNTGKDVIEGAAMEAGGQVAGKAIPIVAKGIGKVISAPLGVTTGTGTGTVEEAFKNHPGFRQGLKGEITEEGLLESMVNKLSGLAQRRGETYREGIRGLKSNVNIDPQDVGESLYKQFDKFGIKATKEIPDNVKGIWNSIPDSMKDDILKDVPVTINTRGSRGIGIRSQAEMAKRILDDFHAAGDYSPYGFDTLRMNLRELSGNSPEAASMLKPVIEDITNKVSRVTPGYRKMLSDYGNATNKINELKKVLSIKGEGENRDTAIRKLSTIFRDVNKYRLDNLNELDPNGELMAQAAGLAMKSGLPRGQLTRMFTLGGAGTLGFLLQRPGLMAAELALSSPRLVGEGANLAGKAYRAVPDRATEAFIRALILRNSEQ